MRFFLFMLLGAALGASPARAAEGADLFARDNLVAWCIVPFDARQRGPEARAEMLSRLGFKKFAYDWRDEHIPTFDEEIEMLTRYGVELTAWWFPADLGPAAQAILAALQRHNQHPQLWVSMHGGEVECTPEEHAARVKQHVEALRPIAEAAAAQGCKVGLYNHMGWFGEPENQVEILQQLKAPNVGIVYNMHHGHAHLDRFATILERIKPYLYCLNLNGMEPNGDKLGKKIWPLGSGSKDLELLRTIQASGYTGPIGILGHTQDDAELTLHQNLDGLDWLLPQLDGTAPAGPRPALRVGAAPLAQGVESLSPAFGKALSGGMVVEGNDAYRTPPVTVELRARLSSSGAYNILVASDTKASGAHWEIFTEPGSGHLTVYTPGLEPDHLRSGVNLVDGTWHQVTLHHAPDSLALFVNGAEVARQAVRRLDKPVVPGSLAVGQLVEGIFHCDGVLDDVRVSRGIREVVQSAEPLVDDDATIILLSFDDLQAAAAGKAEHEVEDAAIRAALPEYQMIPAAAAEELSRGTRSWRRDYAWTRSHGGPHNARYAALRAITRENVAQLQVAWDYRSEDGAGNVQCNPIVVEGVLYAPTAGEHMVALDGATGRELWRFKPGGKPAFRGLTWWGGSRGHPPRLLFNAGEYLWAVDPATGQPLNGFGAGGRVRTGEVRVAGALYRNTFVIAGFEGDVFGYDVRDGNHLWTFRTIPSGGELGGDSWSAPGQGANSWGGIALDDRRGLIFVSTGSPKPNFAGNTHTGQNLFANCVIALDAQTGQYRWHFQEIRHDIWDLDIPAPPNLVTVKIHGRTVDAVAQVTKLGNTLLLDRESGKPLYPVRLRRAPASKLPGERTWPYQPDIEIPEPFARQEFTLDEVTTRTDEARAFVLQKLERANHGWFEPFEEYRPTALYGIHGGAEWTGAAYDPARGRLYVSANNVPWLVTVFRPDRHRPPGGQPTPGELLYQQHCAQCHGAGRFGVGMAPPLHGLSRRLSDADILALFETGRGAMPALAETVSAEERQHLLDYLFLRDVPENAVASDEGPLRYTHNGYPKLVDHEGYPGCKPPWGTLNCIDLNTGKLEWQVPLGHYPELALWGEDDTGAENFGGPSVTAGGVVFCAGTPDNLIRAFDAETGAVLWQHELPFGGYAPPIIYEAGGRQYVAIAATGGGKLDTTPGDAWVAFALP
jgi:quinoprotein glucose dehydrogenase